MPLNIIRTDITTYDCDAIVIPTDSHFSGSGSMDYLIHRKCGKPLEEHLSHFRELKTGDAVCVDGFTSRAGHIIFTHGPEYQNDEISAPLLRKAYRSCLTAAKEQNCQNIALPLISSGTFGYPKDKSYHIATETIRDYLETEDMDITLVLYDDESCRIASEIEKNLDISLEFDRQEVNGDFHRKSSQILGCSLRFEAGSYCEAPTAMASIANEPISFSTLDEGFQKTLFRLIDEKQMSDVEVYKRANLDKRLFSKIRSNENYHPKKETVLALAIALRLSVEQTRDLLDRAGYSLSRSLRLDVIVESFIQQKNYDIDEINVVLFDYDQPLLGAK